MTKIGLPIIISLLMFAVFLVFNPFGLEPMAQRAVAFAVFMVSLYFLMTKLLFRVQLKDDTAARVLIKEELKRMGPVRLSEKRVLTVFGFTAFLWIFRDRLNKVSGLRLDDNLIAVLGVVLLFILPSGDHSGKGQTLLHWSDTGKMSWGILLLFGGGITLANQLEKAGIIGQLGRWMASGVGDNLLLVIFIITLASIFISELLSNVAQVIVFASVITGMAEAMQIDPLLLATPMVFAASCASMLPMGTPPNAIVFASGRLELRHMVRTGFVMNLLAVVLITKVCYFVLPNVVDSIR